MFAAFSQSVRSIVSTISGNFNRILPRRILSRGASMARNLFKNQSTLSNIIRAPPCSWTDVSGCSAGWPTYRHLLEMPQGQPLPGPAVDENMSLLPVAHIMTQHLAGIGGQLHGLGRTRDEAPSPAVVLALGLGEGDLAGIAVLQLDPSLQDLPGSGGGL